MSETFPDDVLTAAQWVNRLILAAGDREEREVTIARAIAAERERCAEIADGFADRYDAMAIYAGSDDLTPIYRKGERASMEIAAAIRGTNA